MRSKKLLAFLLFIPFCLSALGCNNAYSAFHLTVFGTDVYCALDISDTQTVKEAIRADFTALDGYFSVTDENSFVSKFNAARASGTIDINEDFYKVFTASKVCSDITGGRFNPAVLPLLKLYKLSAGDYPANNFTPPSDEDIERVKHFCDFDKAELISNGLLKKLSETVKLDFGGIVKGYACEKAKAAVKSSDATKGYISVGASSLYILKSDDDLSVVHPRKDGYIAKIGKDLIQDTFISTSGDYERFYEYGGKRYCHVLSAESGKPCDTGFISATVIASDGCLSDALSTALCLFSHDEDDINSSEAVNFIKTLTEREEFSGWKFLLVYSGTVKQVITNIERNSVSVKDAEYSLVTF